MNFLFPVGDQGLSSDAYYRALAEAKDGFYPIGKNRLWHGGIHIDKNVIDALKANEIDHMPEVKCIADGEVIAYRINDTYSSIDYDDRVSFYSSGFVLVRHLLQMQYVEPPLSTDNDYKVILGGSYMNEGVNIRDKPSGKLIGLISNGAEITINLEKEYKSTGGFYWYPLESITNGYSSVLKLKVEAFKMPPKFDKETYNCLGWLTLGKTKLTSEAQTIIGQKDDPTKNSAIEMGLAIKKSQNENDETLSLLPVGSVIKVSEFNSDEEWAKVASLVDGSYSSTPNITGWVQVSCLTRLSQEPEQNKINHSLYLYSLYMHLADKLHYENYPSAVIPPYFPKNTYEVTNKDLDKIKGLCIRSEPLAGESNKSNILGVLQCGTKVNIHLNFKEINKPNWYAVASLCDDYQSIPKLSEKNYTLSDSKTSQTILGWIFIAGSINNSGEYTISNNATDENSKSMGLSVRKSSGTGEIASSLPEGCTVSISQLIDSKTKGIIEINANDIENGKATLPLPEGNYFIDSKSLSLKVAKKVYNQTVVLDKTIAVSANQVIGHIGHYHSPSQSVKKTPLTQNIYSQISTVKPYQIEPLLHLELFTCNDLPDFIKNTQKEAKKIKEKDKLILLINKDAKLYLPSFSGDELSIAADIDVEIIHGKGHKWVHVKERYTLVINASKYGYNIKEVNACRSLDVESKNHPDFIAAMNVYTSDKLTSEDIPSKIIFTGKYFNPTKNTNTIDRQKVINTRNGFTDIEVVLIRENKKVWIEASELNDEDRRLTLTNVITGWLKHPLATTKTQDDLVVGYPKIINLNDIINFGKEGKAIDESGNSWLYITAGSINNVEIKGWVNTKQDKVKRVSPWEWSEFELIDESQSLQDKLRLSNIQIENQAKSKGDKALSKQGGNHSKLITRLLSILKNLNYDDADEPLTEENLKAVLRKSWLAQQIGYLLVKYESEWFAEINDQGEMPKWEALNDQLTGTMQTFLDFMLQRYEKQEALDRLKKYGRELALPESKLDEFLRKSEEFLASLEVSMRQADSNAEAKTYLEGKEAYLTNNIELWEKEKERIKSLLWWSDVSEKLNEQQAECAKNTEQSKKETDTEVKDMPSPLISNDGHAWYLHPVGMKSQFFPPIFKRGDKNELIREVNIRLAGFGGNVPTDDFDERTENTIKQFQRDYMKVSQTGLIDRNLLDAADSFQKKYPFSVGLWDSLSCDCKSKGTIATNKVNRISEMNYCDGFGDQTGATTSPEKNNKYEYPGLHRSLLNALRALFFYFDQQEEYKFRLISSAYRCRFKNYATTNHQGKALDIQFYKGKDPIGGQYYSNIAILDDIRQKFFVKYISAQTNWNKTNFFSLEPLGLNKDNTLIDKNHTYSWIHLDVRAFERKYLNDEFFCKNDTELNGKKLTTLVNNYFF